MYVHCVSKKFPPLNSVTFSNLNHFQNFCTAGKRMKFATKFIRHYPPHLRHVATLPWEIKNSNFLQIWKKMQTNSIFNSLELCKLLSFPVLIANTIFQCTVVLFIHLCDQFVAPEIRHSRHHRRVSQQPTWY